MNEQNRLFQSSFTVINRTIMINDANSANSVIIQLKSDQRWFKNYVKLKG